MRAEHRTLVCSLLEPLCGLNRVFVSAVSCHERPTNAVHTIGVLLDSASQNSILHSLSVKVQNQAFCIIHSKNWELSDERKKEIDGTNIGKLYISTNSRSSI